MANVTIKFALTSEGQKDAILSGKSGKMVQSFEVPADHPDFAEVVLIGKQDGEGNTVLDCSYAWITAEDHPAARDFGSDLTRRKHFDFVPTITQIVAREREARDRIGDAAAAKALKAENKRLAFISEFLATPADSEKHREFNPGRGSQKYVSKYSQSRLDMINGDENAVRHFNEVLAAIGQANADAEAARLEAVAKEDAKKAAREAEQAAELDRLKKWGKEFGSVYAKSLIRSQFEGWADRTAYEVATEAIKQITAKENLGDLTEDVLFLTCKKEEPTKEPTLAEVQAFERMTAKAKELTERENTLVQVFVSINRRTYEDKNDPEADDFTHNEISVTVETNIGKEFNFFYSVKQ